MQNSTLVDFIASNRFKIYRVSDSTHEFGRYVDQWVSLERQAPLDKFQIGDSHIYKLVNQLHNNAKFQQTMQEENDLLEYYNFYLTDSSRL